MLFCSLSMDIFLKTMNAYFFEKQLNEYFLENNE